MATGKPVPQGKREKSGLKPRVSTQPILSGRMEIVLVVLAALLVIPLTGAILLKRLTREKKKQADTQVWSPGESATVKLTVITADIERLACADDRSLDKYRCAFDGQEAPVNTTMPGIHVGNHELELQPYRSTDGQLLLIAGLWAQPAVATRTHQEPFQGIKTKKLARFQVSCDLEFQENWSDVKVRWKKNSKWRSKKTALVALPTECTVLPHQPASLLSSLFQ